MRETPPSIPATEAPSQTFTKNSVQAVKDLRSLVSDISGGVEVSELDAVSHFRNASSAVQYANSGYRKFLSFYETVAMGEEEESGLRSLLADLRMIVVKDPELSITADQLDPTALLEEATRLNEEREKVTRGALVVTAEYLNMTFKLEGANSLTAPPEPEENKEDS